MLSWKFNIAFPIAGAGVTTRSGVNTGAGVHIGAGVSTGAGTGTDFNLNAIECK